MQAFCWLGNPQSFWFDLENSPSSSQTTMSELPVSAWCPACSHLQCTFCLDANLPKTYTSDRSISQSSRCSRSSRSSSPSSSSLYCKQYKQTSFLPKASRGRFRLVAIHSMHFWSLLYASNCAAMHGVNKVEKPNWQQFTMVAFKCQFWKLPANHSPKTFSPFIESCCNAWCNSVLSQSLVLLSHHTGPEHKKCHGCYGQGLRMT